MIEVCAKCKTDSKRKGAHITEGGEVFYFCVHCSEAVEKMTQPILRVNHFLDDKKCESVDNTILRNIILARMRRATKELKK